ncbi:hypothetical protein NXC24_PC01379 (plasmid) [Rhizobium sp. NXC24]|nr:hypothetical protein NXC24_PC01379 [Rhizobium sp. NXC24]
MENIVRERGKLRPDRAPSQPVKSTFPAPLLLSDSLRGRARADHVSSRQRTSKRLSVLEVHAIQFQSTNLGLPIVMIDGPNFLGNPDEHCTSGSWNFGHALSDTPVVPIVGRAVLTRSR